MQTQVRTVTVYDLLGVTDTQVEKVVAGLKAQAGDATADSLVEILTKLAPHTANVQAVKATPVVTSATTNTHYVATTNASDTVKMPTELFGVGLPKTFDTSVKLNNILPAHLCSDTPVELIYGGNGQVVIKEDGSTRQGKVALNKIEAYVLYLFMKYHMSK